METWRWDDLGGRVAVLQLVAAIDKFKGRWEADGSQQEHDLGAPQRTDTGRMDHPVW